MLAKILSAAVQGIDAVPVNVEVDIAPGLPTFSTVGLPDAAVRESKDRVVAAVRNSGFDFPPRRVTVNLAPADIKKEGACFDLPIAIGVLAASGEVRGEGLDEFCLLGELALDGTLRPVRGVLPVALRLRTAAVRKMIVPKENLAEAAVVKGVEIYPAATLAEVVKFLNRDLNIPPAEQHIPVDELDDAAYEIDLAEIKGQQFAKRALEVAAAGGHNLIMVGPPGSGKTMLACRLPTILPGMLFDEALETTKIHSVAGMLTPGTSLLHTRPFRSPHHTVSAVAIAGGGAHPRPGEVSLAHNGVLFLDELTEFNRDVIEVLRQPLEDRVVMISRAKQAVSFPASFMFVAAMNPCPCGNFGHPEKTCICTPFSIRKYRARISGPMLDRIDLHIEVPALKLSEIIDDHTSAEPSTAVRSRVVAARHRQSERLKGTKIHTNGQMQSRHLKKFCVPDADGKQLLRSAIERLGLSARAYDRILKVSRTIADLAASDTITQTHIAEAVRYRTLDRG